MSKTPWIVAVQNRNNIVSQCVRCGALLTIRLPVAVNIYVAAAKVFIQAHKNCKAKP